MDNNIMTTLINFGPILVMLVIFYLLLYRPQKKAHDARNDMIAAPLKVGSRVITIGGIHGTIISLTDEIVRLKIAEKTEIEVARNAINGVLDVKK